MRLRAILRLRLRSLFSGARADRELDEELQYHLDRQIEEYLAAGMAPAEARSAAIGSVAGLQLRREECRDMRGVNPIDHALKDLAFALRQLRKNPGFAFTAVFVLARGVCASLAIFAFVDATLIKPLPYRDPARLVSLFETNALSRGAWEDRMNLCYPDYLDWKQRNRVFRSFDVYQQNPFLLTAPDGAQPARGARVSAGFFQTLGVAPVLGRDFGAGEDAPSAPRVVILSYAVWQTQYGASRDILGQAVTLDGFPRLVVGVLPRGFHFAPVGKVDFWIPLQPTGSCDVDRRCHSIYGVARLADGMSPQAALANLTSISTDLQKQYPDSNRDRDAALLPLDQAITGDIHPMLMVLLGGAGLLLVISAINVGGLVLLRSEHRQREIAVRTALGASSGRLIAQFATEALALATAGSALGLALASGAIQLLQKLVPETFRARLPFLDDLGVNGHIVIAAASIAVLAAVLLALPPCLGIWTSDLRKGLAEASRGSAGTVWRRLGSHLVVVELATAMVLLVGAGLLTKSLYYLMRVDLGIVPDHLLTVEVAAPRTVYSTVPKVIALTRRIESEVEALPGVRSAGLVANGVPFTGNGNTTWFHIPGRPWHGEHYDAPERDVSPGYFFTLGARMLRGRDFNAGDTVTSPPVTIVNRAFARTYFPNEDAVDRQIVQHTGNGVSILIVGVVDDIREGALDKVIRPVLYFPFDQNTDHDYFSLVVRTSGGEQGLLPAISASIHKIDAGIVSRGGRTMIDIIQDSESAYMHRSLAWLVGGFAAVALLLSVVGLYGVVAYSVSRRNREIGIRTSLGASTSAIYRMILGDAGRLIAVAAAAGFAASIAVSGLLRGLLFGVRSWDITTLALVAGLLSLAALLASLIPARRAAAIDPVESLRAE